MTNRLFRRTVTWCLVLGLGILFPSFARADPAGDEVLDWNSVLRTALVSPLNVPPIPAPAQFRIAATVHVAMFDALNGIERRYTPMHVTADAPDTAAATVRLAGETAFGTRQLGLCLLPRRMTVPRP